MLDYFKVPEKDVVVVKPEILKETTKLMFMKCGVPEDEAELGADVLLHADLRGIETHGVSNLLRNYISWLNSGKTNQNLCKLHYRTFLTFVPFRDRFNT